MKSLARDTVLLSAARIAAQLLLVASTILVARRLGMVGLGQYALLSAVLYLANILTTFGTDMVLIRDIAGGAAVAPLRAALWLQLGLSAVCIGAIAGVAPLIPHLSADTRRSLVIISLALAPLALFSVCTTALRGKERMGTYALLNLMVAAGQVGAFAILLGRGSGIERVAWIVLGVQAAAALIAAGACRRRIPDLSMMSRRGPTGVRALVRLSAPMALLGLLGVVYLRLSIYQTTVIAGAALTGQLSAALRVVEAVKTGHMAAFSALYPRIARAARHPQPSLAGAVSGSARWLLVVAGGLALALSIASEPVVRTLYGTDAGPAVTATRILSWILVPYTINTFLSLSLVAHGREPLVARGLVVSVVVLGALGAWWIPSFGAAGAAWAMLVAEAAQSLVLLAQTHRAGYRFWHRLESVG